MNFKFKINNISTKQFAILKSDFNPHNKEIEINTEIKLDANPVDNNITSSTLFKFSFEEELLVLIETSCTFKISDSFWDTQLIDKQLTIPKNLSRHLTLITIGTTRGILHSKTEGTRYNNLILPAINVEAIINSDAKFDIK